MRLNIDCIRDLLLCVEEVVTPTKLAIFIDVDKSKQLNDCCDFEESELKDYQQELLKKYSNEELVYHLTYCFKAFLLEEEEATYADQIVVKDLSPAGS